MDSTNFSKNTTPSDSYRGEFDDILDIFGHSSDESISFFDTGTFNDYPAASPFQTGSSDTGSTLSAQSGSMMLAIGDPRPTATVTATDFTRNRDSTAVVAPGIIARSEATTAVTTPDFFSSPALDEVLAMDSRPIDSAKETGGIAGSVHLYNCLKFHADSPAAMKMIRYYQHGASPKKLGPWTISLDGQHEQTDKCRWLTDEKTGIQFLDGTSGSNRHVRCRLCNAVFRGKYKREYETGCPFHPSKLQKLWQKICPQPSESVKCQIENLRKFLTALELFPSNTTKTRVEILVDVLCIYTNQYNALRASWTSGQHGGHPRAQLHVAIMHTPDHGWVAVSEVREISSGRVGFRFNGRVPVAIRIRTTTWGGLEVRYILPREFDIKMRNQTQTQTHASASGHVSPPSYADSTSLVRALSLLLGWHWGPLHASEMKNKLCLASSATHLRGKRSLSAGSGTTSKRVRFKEVTEKDVNTLLHQLQRVANGLDTNNISDAARKKMLSLSTSKRWLSCKETLNRHREPNTTKFSSSGIRQSLRLSASPPSTTAAPSAFPPHIIALYRAVSMVTCLTSDGKVKYSTATCVCEDRGFFLTVRHGFPDDLEDVMLVLVHQYCPVANQLKLVCLASVLSDPEESLDVAILVAWVWSSDLGRDAVNPRALRLAGSITPPVPPTQICLAGFPNIDGDDDLPYIFRGSICAPTTRNDRGHMTLKLDVTSYPGQSGAPVVNLRSGRVLGVMTEAPGKDAKGGSGVKFAQWLDERTVSCLKRVTRHTSSDWVTSDPVPWSSGDQQMMRESKPEVSAPSTPTVTRASAPFFTPTATRSSAPNPRRSAASVSGGADHNLSGSSMRDRILSVMQQQPSGKGMTAIEIARSLGLKTKKSVNQCLYQTLEKQGLVQRKQGRGPKPEWICL